jgi:hypothetical protein
LLVYWEAEMKFLVTFKDPDGVYESLEQAAGDSVAAIEDPEEQEALKEVRAAKMRDFMEKWVEYEEYVTIEFDTVAKTAVVVPK